jgi:hypothetical protein
VDCPTWIAADSQSADGSGERRSGVKSVSDQDDVLADDMIAVDGGGLGLHIAMSAANCSESELENS